jgi:cobalt/nickel transport system permease protein
MKLSAGPRASRLLLLVWLLACFALSATTNLLCLGVALSVVALMFWRRAARAARRTLLSVVPLTLFVIIASWAYAGLLLRAPPPWHDYAALGLRATVIAFLTFAVLASVDLLAALAPWPTPSRLLVVTLAQIHALRLLARESWLGLQSRLPRKPSVRDGLANAGGVTATMLTLSARNAREITDALRARGF